MRNLTAFAIILGLPLYGSWMVNSFAHQSRMEQPKVEHLLPQSEIFTPARKPVPEGMEHVRPLPHKQISSPKDIPIAYDKKATSAGLLQVAERAVR